MKITAYLDVVWSPLTQNKWIFAFPGKEGITVICNDKESTDVALEGTGILSVW
jgi:hypothetical protein